MRSAVVMGALVALLLVANIDPSVRGWVELQMVRAEWALDALAGLR